MIWSGLSTATLMVSRITGCRLKGVSADNGPKGSLENSIDHSSPSARGRATALASRKKAVARASRASVAPRNSTSETSREFSKRIASPDRGYNFHPATSERFRKAIWRTGRPSPPMLPWHRCGIFDLKRKTRGCRQRPAVSIKSRLIRFS